MGIRTDLALWCHRDRIATEHIVNATSPFGLRGPGAVLADGGASQHTHTA